MKTPILFKLLDTVEGTFARIRGKSYVPAMDQITQTAFEQWDLKCGRDDVPRRIPHRQLLVPTIDEADVEKLGAVRMLDWLDDGDEVIGGVWEVPENLELEPFETWWPEVPQDLRDKKERGLRAKNGDVIEAHREVEDVGYGKDSTATPVMYAALPAVAAFAFMVAMVVGLKAGFVALLLALPFLVTILQHEGAGDAMLGAVFYTLAPYLMAVSFASGMSSGASGVMAGLASAGGLSTGSVMGMGLVALSLNFILAVGLLAATISILQKPKGRRLEALIRGFKWMLFVVAVIVACVVSVTVLDLPSSMISMAVFILVSMVAPMMHTEKNFNARSSVLQQQGNKFNLGRSGVLANAHVEPRMRQAIEAFKDQSPLLTLGIAKGWLTEKQYPYAPDKGLPMCLSARDLTMHKMTFGFPGIGKTAGTMRSDAMQWIEAGAGGLIVMCGKGSLPGELSALIDLMIAPGVSYAPMQGLDAQGVAFALNSIAIDKDKQDIWDNGAKIHVDHLTVLHEALHQHEKAYKDYAKRTVRAKEEAADRFRLRAALAARNGNEDQAEEANKTLSKLLVDIAEWRERRDSPRQWKWNLDTLVRVRNITDSFQMVGGREVLGQEMEKILLDLGYGKTALGAAVEGHETRKTWHRASIHPELGAGSILDGTLSYFLDQWSGLDARQRGSFLMNVDQRLLTLTRGKYLTNAKGVHWKMLETGEDITCALYGKAVGFDLPETKHGLASLAVSAFAKQRFYADIKKRAHMDDWRATGQVQVMIMIDEAHQIVGDQEAKLASESRSLGLSFNCATQTFESLEDKLGEENAAELLLAQFQNIIVLKTSPRTYRYMEERLGVTNIVRFPRPVRGIDYEGLVDTLANSPLNNPDSFYAGAYYRMKVAGAGRANVSLSHGRLYGNLNNGQGLGWSGHRTHRIDENSMLTDFDVNIGGQVVEAPLVEPTEWPALLTGPGQALIYLNRAGAPRVDFATLPNIGPNDCRKK